MDADIDVAELRAVLGEQHPDLADLPLTRVEGGWGNRMWRLGDELAVRLPRNSHADEMLRREQRWLPDLLPGLPLPVPVPVRVGEPSARFPRTWTVVRWVAGEPADHAPIVDGADGAARLAGFLRALHREAPADAPPTAGRGVPLPGEADRIDDMLADLDAQAGPAVDAAGIRSVWDRARAAPPWDGPRLWLHADLHPANVVTADGRLAGVVDFGELCAGDPAIDLASAWVLLPDGAVPAFHAAYGGVDAATAERARGWAAMVALVLIAIGTAGEKGLPGGKPTWKPAGQRTLERVLATA